MLRIIIQDLLIALVLFTATGCLISTASSVQEHGKPLSVSTLRQVEVGKTTEGWLLAAVGEPTSRAQVRGQDNVELLCYDHKRMKASNSTILFIFAGSSNKLETSRTCFEVTDGFVTRHWTES